MHSSLLWLVFVFGLFMAQVKSLKVCLFAG